jgi:3',5'-cyclic AMP phosphodiesterase CpdA
MAGNHDDRSLIKTTFDLPDDCMEDFIQYSIASAEGLILCLDTQKAGSDAGEFCAKRTEWLQNKLIEAGDTPVFIFMHHPPMPLGLPMQDTDRLQDGQAFLDLIARYKNVKYLFIGHVHRPITGTIQGIPYATMRSVLYQAPPPKPDWDWNSFTPSKEAPNLGVITLKNADVYLHYDQFCDYTVGT